MQQRPMPSATVQQGQSVHQPGTNSAGGMGGPDPKRARMHPNDPSNPNNGGGGYQVHNSMHQQQHNPYHQQQQQNNQQQRQNNYRFN